VGVGGALSLVGAMTIGLFILPLPAVLTLVLLTRRTAIVGVPGAVSGASMPFLYVAYMNRSGPGESCWGTATAGGCDQLLNPLPWLVTGVVLLVAGFVICAAAQGAERRRSPRSGENGGSVVA
jgi:hypothetical protein